MPLLNWGDTNVADGDSKYISSAYNQVEAISTLDDVVPSDTNRPTRNIYQTQYETYKFLENLTEYTKHDGVVRSSLGSTFALDGDTDKDIVSVNLNGSYKHYARLTPGISFNNGHIAVNSPHTHIAERQLTKIFDLEVDGQESVVINYDYATDKYDSVIKKKDSFGNVQTYTFNAGGSKYDNGVSLLEAIYNNANFTSAFSAAISADLTKIKLEPLVEVEDGKTYYWKVQNDGTFIGDTDVGDTDELRLTNFTVTFVGNQACSGSEGDSRYYFQEFNNFQNDVYLNVPLAWGDSSTTRDLSNSDESKVVNKDVYFNFLRFVGSNYDNARFAWSENDIGDTDAVVPAGNDKKFYFNKDALFRWDSNWTTISNLAASIVSGLPIVNAYNELPGDTIDGTLFYVKDVNQLYRYASSFESWITVSDPKKQLYENTGTKKGNENEAGDSRKFSFSGLSWKLDGSNLRVYKNGIYQVFLTGDTGDSDFYKMLDHTSVRLSTTPQATDKITASVFDGGSSFYPEKSVYTSGDTSGLYHGDTKSFSVSFNLVKDKVDVHRNGVLQRESEFDKYLAGGDTGSVIRVCLTGASLTSANEGDFLEAITGNNNGQITQIAIVISGDTVDVSPAFTGDTTRGGDSYMLYTGYDYMVGESQDKVLLYRGLPNDEFIDIRDRAAIISSDLNLVNKGDTLADVSNPAFGHEFFHTGDSLWFKYVDTTIGWVQL